MAQASSAPNSDDRIADLMVISYEKLLSKDEAEAARLLHACSEAGFFYLNIDGIETKGYLDMVNDLFGVSKEYFSKPIEEKLKDTNKNDITIFNICG